LPWRSSPLATAFAAHVFSDVPDGAFYAAPVEWAFENEITTGTSATTFSPLDNVTRGESVTFLQRYEDNVVQPALAKKADFSNVRSLAESDALLAAKADADDIYTQAEVDALLAAKANASDVPETNVASAAHSPNLSLNGGDRIVVNTNIFTSGTSSLLVTAAVEVSGNGGDNDNMNCNLQVNNTNGLRQSLSLGNNTVVNRGVLTMTQAFPVSAGTHTVFAECNESQVSAMVVDSASIVVLAIDS
jgi:hypothetical protein